MSAKIWSYGVLKGQDGESPAAGQFIARGGSDAEFNNVLFAVMLA